MTHSGLLIKLKERKESLRGTTLIISKDGVNNMYTSLWSFGIAIMTLDKNASYELDGSRVTVNPTTHKSITIYNFNKVNNSPFKRNVLGR
ncbi:hypothetical protein GCM10011344_32670 [Dokdonia pacifica]|uniref:Uncharacterized protein n=1 Tax=Dokdonia pacifica TaxID=1627892 RepID=A0A239BKN8_9FLAO|nr:hypothetical protein [Dokdonia pacifica]GGG29284.1 hypothetical protein GCM10011344_32670 [Dokdonia pacifica]SNS07613.1 hypothetical protein SAMN06265376_106196 [Dokdonia pacifica]